MEETWELISVVEKSVDDAFAGKGVFTEVTGQAQGGDHGRSHIPISLLAMANGAEGVQR